MRITRVLLTVVGGVALAGAGVAAQDWGRPAVPRIGACFYEDMNYRGQYFCVTVGGSAPRVQGGANDSISSIRVFGSAEVTVFKDASYRGASRRFTSNMSDLRRAGWNDRISSYRVEPRSNGNAWGGGGAYGGGGGFGGGAYGGGSYGGAYGGGGNTGRTWGTTGSGVNRLTRQQARQIVERGYRVVLRRDPDPGAEPWVDEVIKRNLSQAQFNAELMKTDEYRRRGRGEH